VSNWFAKFISCYWGVDTQASHQQVTRMDQGQVLPYGGKTENSGYPDHAPPGNQDGGEPVWRWLVRVLWNKKDCKASLRSSERVTLLGIGLKSQWSGLISWELNFVSLEPYAGKLARTVLKGESGGNPADLLNKFIFRYVYLQDFIHLCYRACRKIC
jgi:hypothetical protein